MQRGATLMERRNDVPPTNSVRPMEAPPDSLVPTTAQLKADIDSGRTGDKVPVFDPGLSPLGTDDEAAGTPNGPERVGLARRFEKVQRWAKGARASGYVHHKTPPELLAFIGCIVVAGCLMVGGIVWGRSW
jgi:hypothetical protein